MGMYLYICTAFLLVVCFVLFLCLFLDPTRLGLPGWRLEFVQRRVRATLRPFDPHGVFVVCFVCFVRVGRMAAVPLFNVSASICTEFLHPYPMQTTAQVGAESLASGASQRDTQARTKSAQTAPQTRRKAHKSAQKAPPKRTRAHQKATRAHKSAHSFFCFSCFFLFSFVCFV